MRLLRELLVVLAWVLGALGASAALGLLAAGVLP